MSQCSVTGTQSAAHGIRFQITFDIFIKVAFYNTVFCLMTPCSVMGGYGRFDLQGRSKTSWYSSDTLVTFTTVHGAKDRKLNCKNIWRLYGFVKEFHENFLVVIYSVRNYIVNLLVGFHGFCSVSIYVVNVPSAIKDGRHSEIGQYGEKPQLHTLIESLYRHT